jgi:hypothetical protein
MTLTHRTFICLDQWDRDKMHVYTRTYVNDKPNGNTYHDFSLKVDELDSWFGEHGRAMQKQIADDSDAYTNLTPVVLTMALAKPGAPRPRREISSPAG